MIIFGSVWFGFFRQKPVQTDLTRFFSLARFFKFGPVWLEFFQFFFGLVRFFGFRLIETETEPVGFFKILISFFHGSVFSIFFLFFSI
jgi:hypothetical protein